MRRFKGASSLIESTGIIVSTRIKIETELKKKRAYDEKTALDPLACNINMQAVLNFMEESGLIAKTVDGKIYMTKKGQSQQLRGFSINKIPPHTVVKFSRNK